MSQRIGEEVRAESGLGNPKINRSPSLEESLTDTIAVKKDSSNRIVRLGRTKTRKIEEVRTRLMIKIPQPL